MGKQGKRQGAVAWWVGFSVLYGIIPHKGHARFQAGAMASASVASLPSNRSWLWPQQTDSEEGGTGEDCLLEQLEPSRLVHKFLAFTLMELGSHQRVLSKGKLNLNLPFKNGCL